MRARCAARHERRPKPEKMRPAGDGEPVAVRRPLLRIAGAERGIGDADDVVTGVANRERQQRVRALRRDRGSQQPAAGARDLDHEIEPAVQRPRLADEDEPLTSGAVKPVGVDAVPQQFPLDDRVGLDRHCLGRGIVARRLLHDRQVADEKRPRRREPEPAGDAGLVDAGGNVAGDRHDERRLARPLPAGDGAGLRRSADARMGEDDRLRLVEVVAANDDVERAADHATRRHEARQARVGELPVRGPRREAGREREGRQSDDQSAAGGAHDGRPRDDSGTTM